MTSARATWALLAAGLLLAVAAAVAAPSSELLPAPTGAAQVALAAAALASVFILSVARPLAALYALVALAILEGAIRKWVVNDLTVFLLKDFVALGIYAAVLPRLTRNELRRPWWLLAPLAALVALAFLHVPLSDSLSQAAVGLRSYLIYVPLLWAAPALVTTRARAFALVGLVMLLGAANAVLAVVQARSGPGVLNELVSGATAPLITVAGEAYIRPSGTFMQVGSFAAFLFLAVLAAFAAVLGENRRWWWAGGLCATALLSWGVVYSSARSLLAGLVLAYALLVVAAVARRRLAAPVAVAAAVALGLVGLFQGVPWTQARGTDAIHWVRWHDWVRVAIPRKSAPPLSVRVPPELADGLLERIRTTQRKFDIPGLTDEDVRVTITIVPRPRPVGGGGSGAGGGGGGAPSVVAVGPIDTGGPRGEAPAGGFLDRATDFNTAGGEATLWSGRVRPQLELIAEQRLAGHGTGTMTLGSGYADAGATVLAGEAMYSKAAWELGLPGLLAFLWLVGALAVGSVVGYLRSSADWTQLLAGVAAAACLILPVWYLFTFALDFPVVAILVYVFAGCAVGLGLSPAVEGTAAPAPSAPERRAT